ncbi:MAG: sigma-54 interaction domain-containing protein [Planctomycetota bacterium]
MEPSWIFRFDALSSLTGCELEARQAPIQEDAYLGLCLSLAELTVTAHDLEGLLRGVVRIAKETTGAERVVPILERDGTLEAFEAVEGRFCGAEEAGVPHSILQRCRGEGIAGVWSSAESRENAVCSPIRFNAHALGYLYGQSVGGSGFGREDLYRFVSIAVQAGMGIEGLRRKEKILRHAESLSRRVAEGSEMIGGSPAMRDLWGFVHKAAPSEAGVLICGETGTGKEVLARTIHRYSPRRTKAFEAVNCAAVPPSLMEDELFGHARGAFSGAVTEKPGRFELADGGTLFLDEITEMSSACQAKLLRAVEEGSVRRLGETRDRRVDIRILAATNTDVESTVREGGLREDLFYRLDRLRVVVPPLRERPGDIEPLAVHFAAQCSRSCNRPVERIAPDAIEALRGYGWPGNVRELRNVIERMVILGEGPVLSRDDVPNYVRDGGARKAAALESLEEMERKHVLRALELTGGNKSEAASLLGIDRSTLYAKLDRYGVGR